MKTFPNIHPINIGKDGWATTYPDAVSRLLFHCGLRPCSHGWMVRSCMLTPAQAEQVTRQAALAVKFNEPYYVNDGTKRIPPK